VTGEGPGHPASGLPSFGFPGPRRITPMIDNPHDAFAQYEAKARLRVQLAR